ncbi:unnamed protein product [Agarophyton chilense]
MSSGAPPADEAQLPPTYTEGDHYYYDDANSEHMPPHGWYEHSCTQVGHPNSHNDPVRALACDPRKELIWVATASGMLHAHHAPDMARIVSAYIGEPTSDPSNHGDVRDILVSDSFVLAALSYGLAVVQRGGVLSASVRADTIRNPKAIALNPMSDNHVCIGGESRMLAVIDIQQQRILRQATLRGATGVTAAVWTAPQGASSLAVFSTSTGRISMCDPSTMREVNAIAAFAGTTTSIASSGYYLAATGLGTRGGVSYLEQTVKLYDIRAVQNPLPSVLFSTPPMFIAFDHATSQLYNTDGALWILSPHGVMQLLDISTVTNREPAYPLCDEIHLDAGSDVFTSMVVSSQGLLVLGDSGGFVHQWSSSDFLFHMFELGGAGMACEAGNFTRAFMTMANAGALGLLDGAHALPLSQRIENFTRYLLEQLHKDEGVEVDSTVLSVFGAETWSHGTFMGSKTNWERTARPFQHSLIYNVPETNEAPVDVREVIGEEKHNAAIGLQSDEQVPGKGTVLALDCEFVMVARDEANIFGDGTWQVVVPARKALARVSVIRGYGTLKGVALIDDYVAVREPVVDYLTRFSGLSEGDLDALRSSHKVSSLKTVYKRLRCLVDAGCMTETTAFAAIMMVTVEYCSRDKTFRR